MSIPPIEDKRVGQLIDANLDRAREGLRVVEEWCRFALEDKELVITLKDWRQQLGKHHLYQYKQCRALSKDQGIGLKHPLQDIRELPEEVITANCARVQEALRVLEEFTYKVNQNLAACSKEIRYGLYELELTILKTSLKSKRLQKLISCNLYLITSPKENITEIVEAALLSGVGIIQYRCKEGTDLERLTEAKNLSFICKKYQALFIINDRIDIALAVDADGVHLGQDDLPTSVARKLIGEELLIGKSTHSIEQLKQAASEGCDYLGLGPINSTQTKPGSNPIGLELLLEASNTIKLPWFAIGGINTSTISSILSSGASRVAVVGAIMNANDPSKATLKLLENFQ